MTDRVDAGGRRGRPTEQVGVVWIYVLVIAGYPVISSLPLWMGLDSRTVTVPYRAAVMIFSLGTTLYALRRRQLYTGLFWVPLVVFMAGYIVRLSVDTVYVPLGVLRMPPEEYWLYAIGTCFVPMLPFFTLTADTTMVLALRAVFAATFIGCILAVVTALAAFFSGSIPQGVPGMRLGTDTLNPVSLGHLGVSLIVLAIAYLILLRPTSYALRVCILVGVIFGMFTALASASKGPLLSLLAVTPVIAWSGIRMGMRSKVMMFGILGVMTLYAGAQYVENSLGFDVIGRLEALASGGEDESNQSHAQFMSDAWDEFVNHPVLGSAIDELNSHDYPHNVVIESFMATGIVGGTLFLILILASAYSAILVLRFRPVCMWVVLLYVQTIVAAQVSGALYESAPMWCLMAAVIGLAATVRARTPLTPVQPARS